MTMVKGNKRRFSIRNKLFTGFAALFLVLLVSIVISLVEVYDTEDFAITLNQEELPMSNAIDDINVGLQGSLAALRGWMLTGNKDYVEQRKAFWTQITNARNLLNNQTKVWQQLQGTEQWQKVNSLLIALDAAQINIEKIANSDQENKALTLLKTQGIPNYTRLHQLITQMIEVEKQQVASATRKTLFANMAAFRDSLASSVGGMHLYLVTGNAQLIDKINQNKKNADTALQNILRFEKSLTALQASDFRDLQQNKISFFTMMNDILELRQKNDWNMANYLFATEVAPKVHAIQEILVGSSNGSASGLAVTLKKDLLSDMKAVQSDLHILGLSLWTFLFIGLILSVIISWFTARNIVNPVRSAIDIANRITQGEREFNIDVSGNDEVTDLIESLSNMHDGINEAEKKLKYSEAKVKNLLEDLQKRIRKYRDYITSVAQGDLTKLLVIEGDDDLAELGKNLNQMTDGLSHITLQIVGATNEISSGLSQLESAASSQAASAAEQATSVTELSSVVEEIRATSQQTLDKAQALGQSAEKTYEEGEKGQASVNEMSESMQSLQKTIQQVADTILRLSEQTQQIGEITEAVSDIAKQSKMLALNASIEAAKAGEAGKGFAVVAGEVKELADKSQTSTERVQKILQDIRQTAERAVMVTEEGTKQVSVNLTQAEAMRSVMDALSEVIQQSSMASQQIVAAVRQESVGIDQVVSSISEIDKVTNQFTSSTEQTQSASMSLAKVAESLQESVSVYKLAESNTQKGEKTVG